MTEDRQSCPFVYANGKKCDGCVDGWKLYGHRKGEDLHFTKKVRLWCSRKFDHAGGNSSWAAKERMEFYPDSLPAPIYRMIVNDLEQESA